MKKKTLKAGQRVFFVSDEVGMFSGIIKEVEYDLAEDAKSSKDKLVVSLILEEIEACTAK